MLQVAQKPVLLLGVVRIRASDLPANSDVRDLAQRIAPGGAVVIVAVRGIVGDWAGYIGAAGELPTAVAQHGHKLIRSDAVALFPACAGSYRP